MHCSFAGAAHSEQQIPQETDADPSAAAAAAAAAAADPAADKPPPSTPASAEEQPPAAPAADNAPGAEAPQAAGAEAIAGQEAVGDQQQQQKQQVHRGPAIGKHTTRKSTGGKAPRKQLVTLPPAAPAADNTPVNKAAGMFVDKIPIKKVARKME